MAQLSVITMNCLGLPVPIPGLRRRLQALGQALTQVDVDVACLQEVGRWRHLPLLRHDETYWPRAIAFNHPYAPKGGLVTLTRLPVVDTGYDAFKERGSAVSMHATERYQNKGILRTTVMVGQRKVVVLNTHLSANYNAQWSYTNPYAKVERAQLREVTAAVRAIPEETMVVVAGDFNVPRGSWLYQEFLREAGLHDPLAGTTEPTFRPAPGMPARAAQALDHVLVRPPANRAMITHAQLCFREPALLAGGTKNFLSDHLGVRLTLTWRERESSGATDRARDES